MPYKQVSLFSPEFPKQCICSKGGPDGKQRCHNKSYSDSVVSRRAGLAAEAQKLRAELQTDWAWLSDWEREIKATRLAELMICRMDNGAGRSIEARDRILAQRREEEARWPRQGRVPASPSGCVSSRDASLTSGAPSMTLAIRLR